MTRWGSTRRGRFAFSWDVTALNRPKVWADWTDENTWTVAVSWGDSNSDALSFYVDLRLPEEGLQTLVRRWTTLADFPDRLTVGPPLTLTQMGRIVGKGLAQAFAPIIDLASKFQRETVAALGRMESVRLEGRAMGLDPDIPEAIIRKAMDLSRTSTRPFLPTLDTLWMAEIKRRSETR